MGAIGMSGKLKIAIVLDRFVPSRGGESYFSSLAGELCKRGHEVHVFAMAAEKTEAGEYQPHRIPVLAFPGSLRILSFLFNSARAVKPYDFDIIHGVGRSLAMNVFNPHGGVEKAYLRQEFASINSRSYRAYKLMKRYLSPQHYLKVWIQKKQVLSDRVEKIIAISRMVKEDIIRYYGVPEGKIEVVFNCVDLVRFHPRNREIYRRGKRTDMEIDENTVVLLFAGNNYRLKGLEPLLRALVFLKEWFPDSPFRLVIAGRGQIRRYQRMARALGVSDLALFVGPVKEIERYYAASDIYVHPTFYDSCSLTVLEALASGLPVVTTRFNGAADAMPSEGGGKVIEDPADVENLAGSISLFFDEGRRRAAGVVARQWIESYPPDRHIEDILNIYYEVAAQAST
jgi:UDP-glucose:(heptosyl)LPS alpha-1,3-glucosyltransferase